MAGARPRITNGEITVEPVIMRCNYDLPWNRQSSQTACGKVIQDQVGTLNWRIVVEGILTKQQLVDLASMRDDDVVSIITEEFGKIPAAFDNLNVERTDESAIGDIEDVQGPLLSFQLQAKEDTDDEGEGIQFFNENTRGTDYE